MIYVIFAYPLHGFVRDEKTGWVPMHSFSYDNYNDNIIDIIVNNLKSKGYTFGYPGDREPYIELCNHIGSIQAYIIIWLLLKYNGAYRWYRTTTVEEAKEINEVLDKYFYTPEDIDPNWHLGYNNNDLWKLNNIDRLANAY